MSTEKTTTNQYDPSSMTRYQGAQNTLFNTYSNAVTNPYSGPQYQMGLQQNLNASNQLNANNMRNAMSNFQMSGLGNLTGGARASLLSGLGRQASATRQQGFFNNWNTATANQQFGANVLGQMQPLQTGQTQTTSGLGTWLPQVAGAAIGAGMSLATGGASSAGGFGGGALPGGMSMQGLLGGSASQVGSSVYGNSGSNSFFSNQNFNPSVAPSSGTPWAIGVA